MSEEYTPTHPSDSSGTLGDDTEKRPLGAAAAASGAAGAVGTAGAVGAAGTVGAATSAAEVPRKKGFSLFKKKPKEKTAEDIAAEEEAAAKEARFEALPEHEKAILKEQLEIKTPKATLLTFYRFATPWDAFLICVGFFFSIVHGVALPMFTLVVGAITNNFNSFFASDALSGNDFQKMVDHNSLYFVYIGIGIIGAASFESYFMVERGEVLTSRYRKNYLKAVIRQNIAYFDDLGSGAITTRITNDTTAIQEAISEKMGNIVQGVATFITAIVIAFATQWKLSCILLSAVFYIFFVMSFFAGMMVKYVMASMKIYSKGSSVAEEALQAVRNTIAFGAQDRMAEKYGKALANTNTWEHKGNLWLSGMLAFIWGGMFWIYALSYWEGSRLIASGEAQIGKVITVLVAILIGSFQLGNVAPNFQFIAKGLAAARSLNEAIDRVPVIDSLSDEGLRPEKIEGHINLKDVRFRYPSRPDVLVLPDFSLDVPAGKTVALVGMSGSGKSTIVGLLERFYQPLAGSITLDGTEIDKLNLQWLRQQIGYVQQEPTLFAETIFENIAFGLIGTEHEHASPEVQREKVIEACKQANAWDFIQTMTDGLDTNVGDRGFLMSGGQKQRIAIARAIVSDPKILLLDEATSALDTKSEGIVQEALDRAAKDRTTIVIAHRLSTIKDADKIVVMDKGRIIEQGTHHELLQMEGTYSRLVDAQQVTQRSKESTPGEHEVQAYYGDEKDAKRDPQNGLIVQEDDMPQLGETLTRVDTAFKTIPGVDKTEKVTMWHSAKVMWALNKNEHKQLFLGIFCSIMVGYAYIAMAMLSAKVISAIIVPPEFYPHMRHEVNKYTGFLFMVGCISFVSAFVMTYMNTYASEKLVRNIRLSLFKQFMRMDVAFFDHDNNSPGSLTSTLAKDGKAIEGISGSTLGQICQSLATLFGGVITAIPFNWRIALVATACVPVQVACGFLRVYILNRLQERARKVYEKSGSLASQYATAVRTVQSLTRERNVCDLYAEAVDGQVRSSRPSIARSAIVYGLSQGLTPWVIALVFWYGSTQMREGRATVFGYYVVFMAVVLGAQSAGQMFSYAPDMGKARQAAANIVRVLEAQPKIDVWSDKGLVLDPETVRGDIEFKDVHFRYPTRPQVPVLRGLNLKVQHGQYIALVGPSGCGKSTTIGLVERFYDVLKGAVTFDGHNIEDLNLAAYRENIAMVQQEPMLYSGTIRENIVMGYPGPPEDVTEKMLYDVATKANIHDFIMSLPDGYDTSTGSRGSMLSGGQKQRIAIARALIRNPKVLLLDEATSALDSDSEKVVQQALDVAAKGRTTIAVAHRLSTIQNADIIYVFENGVISESGTHQELLALNGRYAELVRLQSLEN